MSLELPCPEQIDRHPELISLVLLDAALQANHAAFLAAHPELFLEDEHGPQDILVPKHVHRLLTHAERLRRAIARYRATLEKADREALAFDDADDGMPF